MTSKEQERKALEKIRKIVAELGEDSYLATAFAGCFDDAEANINDDAAYSYKGRYESAEIAYNECFADLQEMRKERDRIEAQARQEKELAEKQIAELIERIKHLREAKFAAEREVCEARKDVTIACGKDEETKPFARLQYFNVEGFRFINIVEPCGWTNSYKLDEITKLVIE